MADEPDASDIAAYKTRLQREKTIIEGRLPTTMQLASGYPFFKDSIDDDIAAYAREILIGKRLTDDQRTMMEVLRDGCSLHGLMAAKQLFDKRTDTYVRLCFYLARKGNRENIGEWAVIVFTRLQQIAEDIFFDFTCVQ